jgi:hypothetical protein
MTSLTPVQRCHWHRELSCANFVQKQNGTRTAVSAVRAFDTAVLGTAESLKHAVLDQGIISYLRELEAIFKKALAFVEIKIKNQRYPNLPT